MNRIKLRLAVSLSALVVVLTSGVLGLMYVEGFSFLDALYFSVVTVATVGYGDIHPMSPMGKLFAIGLIVAGVAAFTGVAANVVEAVVSRQERKERLGRLNMAIGVFMSEIGTRLLAMCARLDPSPDSLGVLLARLGSAGEAELAAMARALDAHAYEVLPDAQGLDELKAFLRPKAPFLARLLENPNLAEHERFTDLIWAVFHLQDELAHRHDLQALPASDLKHLSGDARRVYSLLAPQWLEYARHLRQDYPYLFSLVARTNPFDATARAVVADAP